MKAAVLVFGGVDELDVVGPFEVPAMARARGAPVDVGFVARASIRPVIGIHGMTLVPAGILDDTSDLLIVPGGGWLAGSQRGVRGEIARGRLPRVVARSAAPGRW